MYISAKIIIIFSQSERNTIQIFQVNMCHVMYYHKYSLKVVFKKKNQCI